MSIAGFFETPHDNKPKFMLGITTYIDESQHSGPDHVVVAGFWGTKDQWESFAPEWRFGLGKRKALHMASLRWNGRNAERRVKPLLAKLGFLPHAHGLTPVYGAVRPKDYADIVEGKTEFEKKLCGYVLCLSIIMASHTTRLPSNANIKLVCEQQTGYEPLARGLFDSFSHMVARDPLNPYFSSIEFIAKDSSLLTQPGDFLAFAIGKRLDACGTQKDLWCRSIYGHRELTEIPGCLYSREKARRVVSAIIDNVRDGRLVGAVDFGMTLRRLGLR